MHSPAMIDLPAPRIEHLCDTRPETAPPSLPSGPQNDESGPGHQMPMRHTDVKVVASVPVLLPLAAPEQKRVELAHVVFGDPAVIAGLVKVLLDRAGLSQAECARRMGLRTQSLSQYCQLRRIKGKKQQKGVSMRWFARVVETCGGKLVVELPERKIG